MVMLVRSTLLIKLRINRSKNPSIAFYSTPLPLQSQTTHGRSSGPARNKRKTKQWPIENKTSLENEKRKKKKTEIKTKNIPSPEQIKFPLAQIRIPFPSFIYRMNE